MPQELLWNWLTNLRQVILTPIQKQDYGLALRPIQRIDWRLANSTDILFSPGSCRPASLS
jgi:hypothetical protein